MEQTPTRMTHTSMPLLGRHRRLFSAAGGEEYREHILHLAAAVCTALVGYAWLLLFPVLAAAGGVALVATVSSGAFEWRSVAELFVLTGLAALISYDLFRFSPVSSADYVLSRDQAPALFALVDELGAQFEAPRIHGVFVSDACEVKIVRAPQFGFPLLRRNALVIGLPVIQGLTPQQFKTELARHMGRLAARHSRITGWLYHLRHTWAYYRAPRGSGLFRGLFKAFFAVYVPLYDRASRRAAAIDELRADEYGVETVGAEDVAETLSALAINERFVAEKFWPVVERMCDKSDQPAHLPFSTLHAAFARGLSDSERRRWLDECVADEAAADDVVPSLADRLDNIACRSAPLPPRAGESAAWRYLNGALPAVARALDERWIAQTAQQREQRIHERRQARKRIERLASAALERRLSDEELTEYARLVNAYEWSTDRPVRYQRLVEARPRDAKFQLALGEVLLRAGRDEGIGVLEHVMALDENCADRACRIIARYRAAKGRVAETNQSPARSTRAA